MELLTKVALVVLGTFLAFIAAWFWKHRDRITKHEDDLSSAGRAENRELAKDLATAGRQTADRLESDRKERSHILEDDQRQIVKRIEALELAVVEIKTPVDLLWAVVQAKLVKDLTHPSPQFHEMDYLMRDYKAQILDEKGKDRLAMLIDARIISTDPEVTEEEKISALLMKDVLEIGRLKF